MFWYVKVSILEIFNTIGDSTITRTNFCTSFLSVSVTSIRLLEIVGNRSDVVGACIHSTHFLNLVEPFFGYSIVLGIIPFHLVDTIGERT